jgi:uncharacterized membrane protein YraQ (UPF0718 family)
MIILMGFVNFFFPVEKVQRFLSRHSRFGVANFMAASFGAITPFCSCSSCPLFIGFLKGGIPIGVTISFLVTSPLVNEIALVIFWSYFGPKLTVLYALTGILIGTFVGMALSRIKYEGNINQWVIDHLNQKSSLRVLSGEAKADFINILKDSFFTFKKIFPYILTGIGLGAAIHGFVPATFFENYLSKDSPFSVPMAALVGVPLYANCGAIVPVVVALVEKGVPFGTAIAFMMSVVGLSLPEAILLKNVMTLRLISVYFGTVALSIIIIGYCFNLLIEDLQQSTSLRL